MIVSRVLFVRQLTLGEDCDRLYGHMTRLHFLVSLSAAIGPVYVHPCFENLPRRPVIVYALASKVETKRLRAVGLTYSLKTSSRSPPGHSPLLRSWSHDDLILLREVLPFQVLWACREYIPTSTILSRRVHHKAGHDTDQRCFQDMARTKSKAQCER